MKYRFLGTTGVRVSEICMGCMTFEKGYTPKIKNDQDAFRILDAYVDQGGNFFDMADNYPGVEELFGRWLKGRSDREQFVLATKVRFFPDDPEEIKGPNDVGLSRKHIMATVDKALRRTHAEYIDVYQMHCWDEISSPEETLCAFEDVIRSGKVRYIGASNFAGWHLTKMANMSKYQRYPKLQLCQTQYNLLNRTTEWEVNPAAIDSSISLTAWSPLGAGWLTGKYSKDAAPPAESRMARYVNNLDDWHKTNELGLNTQIPHPRKIEDEKLREKYQIQAEQDKRWAIIDAVRDVASNHPGATCAQVALSWLLARHGIASLICGFSTVEQMQDNLQSMELKLTQEEISWLDFISHPGTPYPIDFFEQYGTHRR